MVVRKTRAPHSGVTANRLTFLQAYAQATGQPGKIYKTATLKVPFTAKAAIVKSGKHKGKKVIRFMTGKTEKARAYSCCWGKSINCNRTYIDGYTPVM